MCTPFRCQVDPAAVLKWTPELGGWGAFAWMSPTTLFVDCVNGVHTIGRFTVDAAAMRVLAADPVINGDTGDARYSCPRRAAPCVRERPDVTSSVGVAVRRSGPGRGGRRAGHGRRGGRGHIRSHPRRHKARVPALFFPGLDRVALWTTDLLTRQGRELTS